jgi:hypothetical protein
MKAEDFDNRIAILANQFLYLLIMGGITNELSNKKCSHTIYLFSKNYAEKVIEEFGELILTTFSADELLKYKKEGCHVIVMVHDKKEKHPKSSFHKIFDYWQFYEAKKNKKKCDARDIVRILPQRKDEVDCTGEIFNQIEWIAKGFRRLINMGKERKFHDATNKPFYSINKSLSPEKQVCFRNILFRLNKWRIFHPREKWDLFV